MEGLWLFAVCDGHGVNGHHVSHIVKKLIVRKMDFGTLKTPRIAALVKILDHNSQARRSCFAIK